MDARDRAFITDYIAAVVWPTVLRSIATAGQTVFATRGSWDTVNDIARAWVNGVELAPASIAWNDAESVTIPAQVVGNVVIVAVVPGGAAGYLPRSGAAAMTGALNMGNQRIHNLLASSAGGDAVRRDEVAALAAGAGNANYLRRDGTNAPTSHIPFNNKRLYDLGASVADGDAMRRDEILAITDALAAAVAALESIVSSSPSAGAYLLGSPGADSWVVPENVTRLNFVLVGGGGGGGSGVNDASNYQFIGGAGGGVGGTTFQTAGVTPGETLALVCGGPGAGGASGSGPGNPGAAGGLSSVGGTFGVFSVAGGGGGAGGSYGAYDPGHATDVPPTAGQSGTLPAGTLVIAGTGNPSGGAAGVAPSASAAGAGIYGGGGGGGWHTNGSGIPGQPGGAGGTGFVLLWW